MIIYSLGQTSTDHFDPSAEVPVRVYPMTDEI